MDFAKIIDGARTKMKVVSRKRISTGFLKVDKIVVDVDGKPLSREVLQKDDVVAVLAITEEGRVLLCAQPRVGSNQLGAIEIPAGLIDEGETPEEAAERELLEETGYKAEKLVRLRDFYGDPACCNSDTTLFLATGAKKVADQHLDGDEMLIYFDVSWEEFVQLVEDETIRDANTTIACYKAMRLLGCA